MELNIIKREGKYFNYKEVEYYINKCLKLKKE